MAMQGPMSMAAHVAAYTEINYQTLLEFFPNAHFNLWACHYVIVYYFGKNYLYKAWNNEAYSINDVYIPFWFQNIHPYILSKRMFEKYYFIFSTWDGSYVETPFYEGHDFEFRSIASIEEFQVMKRSMPSLLPILHEKKYFGCASKHKNDPISIAIIDFIFIESKGYDSIKKLMDQSNQKPFKEKIIFRGSKSHGSRYNFFNHEFMTMGHREFLYENRSRWSDILDCELNHVSIPEMCRYKFILDVDGWTNAWSSLVWKLYSNSVVLKHESIWQQWYYQDLKPFEHYVPIRNDFSDLHEKFQWCINHPLECELIASNAKRFVVERLNMKSAIRGMQDSLWMDYFSKYSSF